MEKQNWIREELEASVRSYLEMRQKHLDGENYIKKEYYQRLSTEFSRTEKSFEYRMQNISYVFSLMGRDWVKGLKPAKNVGSNVFREIVEIIADLENKLPNEYASFQNDVINSLKKTQKSPPSGSKKPKKSQTSSTKYVRDPEVVAWILNFANSICECCKKPAPFNKEDGTSFLEVHHLKQLADGGSDTTTNAIAVCPNCHRELHFGVNKVNIKMKVYDSVDRLISE